MKRKIALTAVVTLLASFIAGCASSTAAKTENGSQEGVLESASEEAVPAEIDMTGDPYQVAVQVVVIPGSEISDEAAIEAAINEKTVPAINCTVDLQYIWINEIANTTSLGITGNEKLDLVHVATVSPLESMIGSEMLYDMNQDNLLQTHGTHLVDYFGDLMKAGNIDGAQLAVPALSYVGHAMSFYYNKTVADEIGITIPEEGTLEDVEKALYAVKDSGYDIIPYFAGSGENTLFEYFYPTTVFGTNAVYGARFEGVDNSGIVNMYATDQYREYVLRMNRWYRDGIMTKDTTDTNSVQDYFNAQQIFLDPAPVNPSETASLLSKAKSSGFEAAYCRTQDYVITNKLVQEYMWGIAVNSQNPEKAMDFLDYMYTDAEVANLIHYGLEGKNYTFVEGSDKVIEQNGTYAPAFFRGGNENDLYIVAPNDEDYIEQCQGIQKLCSIPDDLGYNFDDSMVQTEAAAISNVIAQYAPMLQAGLCGSEEDTLAYLAEFNSALEKAGINDAIAENQRQFDEFMQNR